MRRKLLYGVITLVVTLSFAACSGDDDEPSSAATTPVVVDETPASEAPSAEPTDTQTTPVEEPSEEPATPVPSQDPVMPAPDPCAEVQSWGTKLRSASVEGPYLPSWLEEARIGRHDCYDRVVFDFVGTNGSGPGAHGYRVEYVPEVLQDGSGKPVPVRGDAALQVILHGGMPDLNVDLADVVDHTADWAALQEVQSAGWFEGQYTIAVGVVDELPFRVGTLIRAGQSMVYVDIAHP